MNTILLYFNVHIQALNIHPLAPLAPLREFFLADIFCVIYISRQAANLARIYSEFILASLAPLRDFFLADIFCEIYFSPSRQGRKGIFRFNLAPFAPLRGHNTSCERTITSCEIVFPPSRQGCKDYAIGKFRSLQIVNDSTYVAIL